MSALKLPYSSFRKEGNWYYISGQIGKDMENNVAEADVKHQTKQLFNNLDAVLTSAGLERKHIVKTTVFLTDMGNFGAMNELYGEYFSEPYPARSTVAVAELPRVADNPMLVEIEAVAYKEDE
jgi:reactive intermediate/imine deaminase